MLLKKNRQKDGGEKRVTRVYTGTEKYREIGFELFVMCSDLSSAEKKSENVIPCAF